MQIKEYIQAWNNIRNSPQGFQFLQAGSGLCVSKEEFEQWNTQSTSVHLYLANKNNEPCFYLIDEYHDQAQEYILGQTIFEKQYIKPSLPPQQPPLKQHKPNELLQLIQKLLQVLDDEPNTSTNKQKELIKASFNQIIDQLKTPEEFAQFHQNLRNHVDAVIPGFRWLMYAPQWFEELAQAEQVVQAFEIPFQDFEFLFNQEDCQEVFLFFALKHTPNDSYRNAIDVFLAQYDPQKDSNEEISFVLANRIADISTPCPPYSATTNFPLLS